MSLEDDFLIFSAWDIAINTVLSFVKVFLTLIQLLGVQQ